MAMTTTITETTVSDSALGTYPAGMASGGGLVAVCASATGGTDGSWTPPSGFTLHAGSEDYQAFNMRLAVFTKDTVTGSETGTETFTQTDARTAHVAFIYIPPAEFGGWGTVAATLAAYDPLGSSATPSSPSVTTTTANQRVIVVCNSRQPGNTAWTGARPAGTTDSPGTPTLSSNFAVHTYVAEFTQVAAGATGAQQWSGMTDISRVFTLAVINAAGGAANQLAWIRA